MQFFSSSRSNSKEHTQFTQKLGNFHFLLLLDYIRLFGNRKMKDLNKVHEYIKIHTHSKCKQITVAVFNDDGDDDESVIWFFS